LVVTRLGGGLEFRLHGSLLWLAAAASRWW
jgi:hypothetical protein